MIFGKSTIAVFPTHWRGSFASLPTIKISDINHANWWYRFSQDDPVYNRAYHGSIHSPKNQVDTMIAGWSKVGWVDIRSRDEKILMQDKKLFESYCAKLKLRRGFFNYLLIKIRVSFSWSDPFETNTSRLRTRYHRSEIIAVLNLRVNWLFWYLLRPNLFDLL